jgi:hypothetical protein
MRPRFLPTCSRTGDGESWRFAVGKWDIEGSLIAFGNYGLDGKNRAATALELRPSAVHAYPGITISPGSICSATTEILPAGPLSRSTVPGNPLSVSKCESGTKAAEALFSKAAVVGKTGLFGK